MRILSVLMLLLLSTPTLAEGTRVVVRARARDGKFVGTSMGGAQVVLRDAGTGQVLARGVTSGTTGDTQRLMKQPHTRGQQLADEKSAKFETTLELDEPRLVTVEVSGPEAQRQARITSSTQVWMIPGRHFTGDGIILELPGFVVDAVEPRAHEFIKLDGKTRNVPVRANVVLMCGCPTEPGGTLGLQQVRAAGRGDARRQARHHRAPRLRGEEQHLRGPGSRPGEGGLPRSSSPRTTRIPATPAWTAPPSSSSSGVGSGEEDPMKFYRIREDEAPRYTGAT